MSEKFLKFYEKLYYHEIDQYHKIRSNLQLPLGMIVIFSGYIGFLIKTFKWNNDFNISIFLFFIIASIITSLGGFCHFCCAIWTKSQELLPTAEKIASGFPKAEEEFDDILIEYYIVYSSINAKINDRLGEEIHSCFIYIILTFVFLLLCTISFTYGEIWNEIFKASDLIDKIDRGIFNGRKQ